MKKNKVKGKSTEETLQESEEKYRNLVELAPDGIPVFDLQGNVLSVNTAFTAITGFSKDDFVGKHFTKMPTIRRENIPQYIKMFAAFVKGEAVTETVFSYNHKDRSIRWAEAHASLVKVKGKPKYIQAILHDITERKQMEEKLRESEEKYRNLIENSKDSVVITDTKGNVVFANTATEELTGYTKEEGLGMNLREVTPLELWPKSYAMLKKARKGEPIPYFESMVRKKDGRLVAVESGGQAIFKDRKYAGVQIITRDITERKRAEEALRASEKRYRTLIAKMVNGFALHEMIPDDAGTPIDYRFLAINAAFEKLTGLVASKIIGKTVLEVLPELEPFWIDTYGKVVLTGVPICFEHFAKPLNKYYEVLAYSTQKGQFATVFTDITPRKEAEGALRESEERYRVLVENADYPITVFDIHGRVILINGTGARNLGRTPEDVIGKSVYELFPYKADMLMKRNQQITESGKGASFEDFFDLPSGKGWFWSNLQPVKDRNGNIYAVQLVSYDTTERKQAESEREKLISELQDALAEVKTLSGLLPICANCKKIRDDDGYWHQVEVYVGDHSEAKFSHGLCPECLANLYPDIDIEDS